jgi:glycosyltransferase involved in cell wall biosynthesis|tara:strand:- start:1328 stop:3238 length:1911 start_codon:yes stop_codon:yes gene_type:complete
MRKKKIVFQSDFSLAKTGFGRNAKAILSYLHGTGKYDLVHYCCGTNWSNQELQATPWKSVGCLPDSQKEVQDLNRDPNTARAANYGAHFLDRIIKQEKPDIYLAVQDIWGVDFAIDKPWFNKINSIIWTTLDSLPILPSAIEKADKIKNYWIWSNFATKALNKMGHEHVKTVHGAVDPSFFYRFSDHDRFELRKKLSIPTDDFIIGFVFRNQLRKSVPNLLEGYKLFKEKNLKGKKTKLLLHTHFGEGWNIMRLAKENGLDPNEILTTYICKDCKNYEIKPFHGQDVKCSHCGSEKGLITTNVGNGITENQLNEVYNLMDVYCHPFTSGGQEIPIQEAKLTELITLVTNYSCGEEMCEAGAASLPLSWTSYREHGTEFIKASTSPKSICKQLYSVLGMSEKEKKKLGEQGRQWVIDNFSTESVGKFLEDQFDNMDFVDYDFSLEQQEKNPNAVIPEIKDDTEWLTVMYKDVLIMDVDSKDSGLKYWIQEIEKGVERKTIEDYFRRIASQDNQKNKKVDFSELLGKDDAGKRMLYVMPESIGDIYLSTSLFRSAKELYPDYNLYVAVKPEYFDILSGNPYIYKTLQYVPQMDSLTWLEGAGDHNGYFEIAFLPYANTQKFLTYLHNGKDKLAYDINY